MFEVIISKPFVAAHNLKLYDGSMEPLHGHNWRTEVTLCGEKLDEIEILIDFLDVKKEAERIYKEIDYTYLNENKVLQGKNPSAEIVAKYIFEQMAKALNRPGVKVKQVKVWEAEDCAAVYYEE